MAQEEKQLLINDLCARLPYGIKGLHRGEVHTLLTIDSREGANACIQVDDYEAWFLIDDFKPYLRPMSSMTNEERKEYDKFFYNHYHEWDGKGTCTECIIADSLDDYLNFCYSKHLDFRGLIRMGLALEAPKDMYKTV